MLCCFLNDCEKYVGCGFGAVGGFLQSPEQKMEHVKKVNMTYTPLVKITVVCELKNCHFFMVNQPIQLKQILRKRKNKGIFKNLLYSFSEETWFAHLKMHED